MNFIVRTVLCVLTILTIVAPVCSQSEKGQIVGTVIDENGHPVANAQVSPQYLGVAVFRTLVITVDTDERGRFRIGHLRWGPYAVYAGKETDRYPNLRLPLYRTRPVPKVTLSTQQPTAQIVVRIGPRAGVLVASVRDALTHALVNSQLVLQRADGSGTIMLSEPPEFRVLLPANTDVSVEIRKKGYKPWRYSEATNRFVRVNSGEEKKLEVSLMPSERLETEKMVRDR